MNFSAINEEANRSAFRVGALFVRQFLECNDVVQGIVREMVGIVADTDASEDEREAAIETIAAALFPKHDSRELGIDLEEADRAAVENCRDGDGAYKQLRSEEESFAERLSELMGDRNISQTELAKLIGVGQSAISMMLSRNCRPQRRTIEKLAAALNVDSKLLWPVE